MAGLAQGQLQRRMQLLNPEPENTHIRQGHGTGSVLLCNIQMEEPTDLILKLKTKDNDGLVVFVTFNTAQ